MTPELRARVRARRVATPEVGPDDPEIGVRAAGSLGIHVRDALALTQKVQRGFPFNAFQAFVGICSGTVDELAPVLQFSTRTLHRRKDAGRLEPDESDRLLRAARILALAEELFDGERSAALAWLRQPKQALGGKTPFELVGTDVGAREVERLITQLEHGVYP